MINGMLWILIDKPFLGKYTNNVRWVGRISALVNSAVNPILYNVTNAQYRAAFAEAFG